MKKSLYVLTLATGIVLLTGCTSFEEAKKAADAGDAQMAYKAGVMLKEGNGVEQNTEQAFAYFEKAVQAGDMPAAWDLMNLIYDSRDVDHSKLFGDCYQLLCTKNPDSFLSISPQIKAHNEGITLCLNYLHLLKKAGRDEETYELKKRLVAIVSFQSFDSYSDKIRFLERLDMIVTKAEIIEQKRTAEEKRRIAEEERRIAEEKKIKDTLEMMDSIKYSSPDGAPGIKLYKHLTSGISLQWFIEESLLKKGEVSYCWHSDYCIALKSSLYPDLDLIFSSSTSSPAFHHFERIRNKSDYKYMSRYLDLRGSLLGVEISLPEAIDKEKVFSKLCKDYPQIKPVFEKNDEKMRHGGRSTTGEKYVWSNDVIYVSFTYEGQKYDDRRKILITDKKLFESLVTEKKEKDKKAQEAAQEAALEAALDF